MTDPVASGVVVADYSPVDVGSIPVWQPGGADSGSDAEPAPDSPFPFDPELNSKIALYNGQSYNVQCDVIVNLMESPTARSVRKLAGPMLDAELLTLSAETNPSRKTGCRTGTVLITPSFNLRSTTYLIHTVDPMYEDRYRVAAENVLHGCYRHCLQCAVEHGVRTVAFAPLHSFERKQYPPTLAVPIVLRTIRRFLEVWGSYIDRVVLCAALQHDLDAYQQLLPIYFPRSRTEQARALQLLPDDIGNAIGETVLDERAITIGSHVEGERGGGKDDGDNDSSRTRRGGWGQDAGKLRGGAGGGAARLTRFEQTHGSYDDADAEGPVFSTMDPTIAEFCSVQPPPHERRSDLIRSTDVKAAVYARFVQRAVQEPMVSHIETGAIVRAPGKDGRRRPILCIFASELPPVAGPDDPMLLLYFVRMCDPLLAGDFTIVVFLHGMQHRPSAQYMRNTRRVLPATYGERLKQLVFVGSNLMLRVMLLALTGRRPPFTVKHVQNTTQLESQCGIPLSALPPLPATLYDHEIRSGASRSVHEIALRLRDPGKG